MGSGTSCFLGQGNVMRLEMSDTVAKKSDKERLIVMLLLCTITLDEQT